MDDLRNYVIDTDLGPVEYSIRGAGQPVVFVHGGHSNSQEVLFQKGWDPKKYLLITPSRPGYGATPLGEHSSPESQADVIRALLDALGITNVTIVGISAGGLTAIAFASQYTHRTDRLILISAVTDQWLSSEDSLYQRGMKMFAPNKEKRNWKLYRMAFRLFPRRMTRILFDELSTAREAKIRPEEVSEVRTMTFVQASGSGFVNDINQKPDSRHLEQIIAKTLIMHSENDKTVDLKMAQFANDKIQNSVLKIYQNKWGHLLWIGSDSDKPISDLQNFLEQN